MKISDYVIDIEQSVTIINKQQYTTIALQLPEGLKPHAQTIVSFIEQNTTATVLVVADPCFGACDLVAHKLTSLEVDCIFHLGHTPLSTEELYPIPTYFLNAQFDKDVTAVVEKTIPLLEGKTIGLVTTAQHLHTLPAVKTILKNHGLSTMISKGDSRIAKPGQILGCNFSAATKLSSKVDSFLFLGSGIFHPIGLHMSADKPVIAANPYTNQVQKKELSELKDTLLRQRYGAIANSKHAKRFGILIGLKTGQQRQTQAYELKALLDQYRKESLLVAVEYLSPLVLESFRTIDCFVSTACPRIAIDDYLQYKTPILTPIELEIVLGKKQWEDYAFDEIV